MAMREKLVEGAFLTGVACATYKLSKMLISLLKGFRTYFFPFGRAINSNLTERFGTWAGENKIRQNITSRCLCTIVITGGTSPIGLAFAHEVSLMAAVSLFDVSYSLQEEVLILY